VEFTPLIQQYGYAIVYLGGVFEGEPVALLGGYAARTQHLRLPMVMLCSQLGVFTSDQFCFYCGRFFGKGLLRRWPRLAKKIGPFTRMIETHRGKLTLSFQWIPGASAVVPTALGMTGMPAFTYLWLDLLGSALWAITIPALGYVFGAAAESVLGRLQGLAAGVFGIIAVILFIIGKRKITQAIRRVADEGASGPTP